MAMRLEFSGSWRHCVGLAAVLVIFTPALAPATEYTIDGRQAQSITLPGGFVAWANPTTGANYMAHTTDIFGDPQTYFSSASVYDTGSSTNIISATEAGARSLPITSESYSDVGIGGMEVFNVSQPTTLKLAPMSVGVDGSEVISNFSPYGTYKFAIRQSDPVITDPIFGMQFPVAINIVGTPVLNQSVMHVQPNNIPYSDYIPTVDYMLTTLSATAPASLHAGRSEVALVPSGGGDVMHIPLSYQNFITGSQPVNTANNPTIPGVQVVDHRLPPSGQSAPTSWLFDTGASVTMVGRNLATAIGIDLNNESPVSTVDVMGIGSSGTLTFNGYRIDNLVVPLTGGNQLDFTNIVVYVPNAGALPADLPGIFGMNLLGQSFSGVDPVTGDFVNKTYSAFNDWYVIPPAPLMAGDANGDGVVDMADLSRVLTNFDRTGMTWANGDFDGNGVVDLADLSKLLANFDKTASAGKMAVPEPSSLALLAVVLAAALGGFALRRR